MMKKITLLLGICFFAANIFAQQQTFDLATFTPPKGWKQQVGKDAIQLSKEDATKGSYGLITLYKSVPGAADAKTNFDMAWASLVKETVTVSAAPVMQPSVSENGWESLSGYSPFESNGNKGMALLITSSSFNKMMNMIILTNTDVYEKEMTAFIGSVDLKKQSQAVNPVKNTQPVSVAKKDGFAFTTSNFDDGWTSTVQEDWVQVIKGNIKVLLHYPRNGTIFPADPEPLTNTVWNILVAPRYSNLKNYKTATISGYNRVYLGMGYLTDNSSGKQSFVVLFRQGSTGWLEIIAPDKNSFIQQYKFDPETVRWDSDDALVNPLIQMTNYNKFAVAAADFTGNWSSDFTGVQQLYNVYTGNYAGMNMSQSNETFQFGAGNTYNWKLLAVNGMVGNAKVAQVKSSGKLIVLNNWQVKLSDIEGKPRIYNTFWSCIKGARILNMLDAQAGGSGIYTRYGVAK